MQVEEHLIRCFAVFDDLGVRGGSDRVEVDALNVLGRETILEPVEEVLLGPTGAWRPCLEVCEVVRKCAVALAHVLDDVFGLGDGVLRLKFHLKLFDKLSPRVRDVGACCILAEEDVLILRDLFQVRASPNGGVAGEEREGRRNDLLAVEGDVTVGFLFDHAVGVAGGESAFLRPRPDDEVSAEQAG